VKEGGGNSAKQQRRLLGERKVGAHLGHAGRVDVRVRVFTPVVDVINWVI
jgi:hypothetical protein